ncbi:hypothetical protein [Thauera sp. GDN1]|uniref:hypothetical protein n=1 Tax=Thauera sp. GDN1 TaxID=2944810 RepID=UPI0024796E76|nr:hypothetical protein [Thauera sp. GDN1]
MLTKHSQLVRYESIGLATGHDKSWGSRFLSGTALASMPELLAWLDQCDLRFVSPEGEEDVLGVTDQERIERLQSAINALELTRGELRTAANINREFILALIEIARVGLDALFEKHLTQPDNSHDDDTTARSLDE